MSAGKHKRFAEKLREHIQFVRLSCEAFDKGSESEAIRIATSLRVIFHQTPQSESLIKHLRFEANKMLSSGKGYGDSRDFLSWVIDLNSPVPVVTKPTLSNQFLEVSIREWWDKETAFLYNTKRYTRKQIVLAAVNQDGGAHVDAKLQRFYEALSAGMEGISITGNLEYGGQEPPFEQGINQSSRNAHLALIRQFAHEFLASVSYFKWLQ
jgi:hypothetical protein